MRIAVNTGGGDAPGLNAVIRAIVLSAHNLGWEVFGIRRGYDGILTGEENGISRLTPERVRGITHLGGTILGTTNRGDPFHWHAAGTADGGRDRSEEVIAKLKECGIDALIAIGGDGSLRIARELASRGLNVIGVPKTIDNDLAATQVTFGFHTAVETATDAIDKLHSTAEAHQRVMVVELMGRHTGWIALYAGVAGTADVILIPEIPYSLDRVCEKIESRYTSGPGFAIVVAAEGAVETGGKPVFQAAGRYGGVGEKLTEEIARESGRETRSLVLGHLQRGGAPNPLDRLLALRFGAAAVQLVKERRFGTMVALHPPKVLAVPLDEAVREIKRVPTDGDLVATARALGVSFGD
jgi:phosphofructokinase-like protein